MKKNVLITGTVMNSDTESISVYNDLISLIDKEKYNICSPLDTMIFSGTDVEKYQRAMLLLENADVVIAEVSSASTGQGMELQQAAVLEIPVLAIAKTNSKVSGLIKGCQNIRNIIYYDNVLEIGDSVNSFITEAAKGKNSINRK